jgi:DNA repair exonuclease SbcCD ATPase subunit
LPGTLPALPAVKDGAEIQRVLMNLVGAQTRLATATQQAATVEAEEATAQAEFKAIKKEMGVCPLCDTHFEEHEAHAH